MLRRVSIITYLRIASALLIAASVTTIIYTVPLVPEVNRHFFFSEDDPQLESERDITAMFGESNLVVLAIEGDISSSGYFEKISTLSESLLAISGVRSLKSLSNGPPGLEEALSGPLWRRLLIFDDNSGSNIVVIVEEKNFSK
ncbi:MAG: hypothetical protein KDD53_04910, partial [Bdellovibrionales bacterium]|nr:hypothetical protein [Bdellovibrionales bacterium]